MGQSIGIFCCSSESKARLLLPVDMDCSFIRLAADGAWMRASRTGRAKGAGIAYWGEIGLAGEQDHADAPRLFRNLFIFDGARLGVLEAFSFLRCSNDRKVMSGLFLEPDSGVVWKNNQFRVVGQGGVAWISPSGAESGPDLPDISQFKSGEPIPPILSQPVVEFPFDLV